MNEKQQNNNFQHLMKIVIAQSQVRNCEIEGSVFDLEYHIQIIANLELISLAQEETLVNLLK